MDQIRTFVRVMWTQRFWVLSVLCTIVGVICWNMAASDLDAEFTKRKSAIDTAYRNVSTIRGEQVHPNDNVNDGDRIQAQKQRDFVLKVWQELYDRQRDEVITWPESLSKRFVAEMKGRKFGADIAPKMRENYHNYIETVFDDLLEIVKAQKIAERGAGGRGGAYGGEFGGRGFGRGELGGGRGAVDGEFVQEDFLVLWPSQVKLQQKLLFQTKPTTMQVWVTQEDLWVYETLLHIIANTNTARGATLPENTAVRAIIDLAVGAETASASTGQVLIPQAIEGAGGFGGRGGEYGDYSMGGEFGGEYGGEYGGGYGGEMGGYGGEYGGRGMGMGMGMEGGGEDALLAMRYLGEDGAPMADASADTLSSTEFRQLPIRMSLKMDQRWIPRILFECANAALPVEVTQVRINPGQSGSGAGSRGSYGGRNDLNGMAPDPSLADVEIHGAVYIYNEPNKSRLAIPGEEQVAAADDSI